MTRAERTTGAVSSASWRSLLYVPANNPRFVAKAQARGADALVFDLEDSIPPGEKQAARSTLAEHMQAVCQGPADVFVRINAGLRLAVRDLEAVVQPGLKGVFLPKCETPGGVALVADVVTELEGERGLPLGRISLVAMIETPDGLFAAQPIATSSGRLVGMLLGGEDFAAATGSESDPDVLQVPRQQMVFAARTAGLAPLGLMDSIANHADLEVVTRAAARASRFGFEGATCVHPAVVPVLNRAFSPSPHAIAWAERVVTALGEAQGRGFGVAVVDGRMVDRPIRVRAERLLARAARAASVASG